jgi:acyl-CoA thioesterase I
MMFSRRNLLLMLAAVATAGCRLRRPKPPLIKIEDYEDSRGNWRPIRVACAGDSITYGAGIPDREKKSYPAQLGELLGSRFEVRNFGRNGATLLAAGDNPYLAGPEYRQLVEWQPDVVILMLGTNDTKPQNWRGQKAFEQDTRTALRALRDIKGDPTVWVCLPVPVYGDGAFGINATNLEDGVIPALLEVTNDLKVPVIDLNDALVSHPEMFPDKIHPDAAGATVMARTVFQAIRP